MNQRQAPTAIAVAVVRRGDLVLIGERAEGQALAGCLEFPGGKIEPGETPTDAARRECLEETGISIRPLRTLQVVDHHYAHGRLRLHFVEASVVEPAAPPKPPFRWTGIAELDETRFPPANAGVLRLLKDTQ